MTARHNQGIIFTCLERPISQRAKNRGWRWTCMAWGETIATGTAPTEAAARQCNRDAKEAYRASLTPTQAQNVSKTSAGDNTLRYLLDKQPLLDTEGSLDLVPDGPAQGISGEQNRVAVRG